MAPSVPFGPFRLICLVLLGGCAAVGAQPSRVEVRLYDARNDLHLALANASHPDLQGLYSQARDTADLKLCRDRVLARLVERLEELGFDRFARPGEAPDLGSLKGWIRIRSGPSTRTFTVATDEARPEVLRAFAEMKLALDQVYGSVGALQFVRSPDGKPALGAARP